MRPLGVKHDNISTMLLFPCLRIRQELTDRFADFGFVSSYLFWERYPYPFNTVYLLFQPKEFTLDFHHFIQNMEKNINFVDTVDVPNKVVVVFRVPARFDVDYLLFLNGAYSKTSPDFKSCFQLKEYKRGPDGKLLKTPTGGWQTEYTMYYHIFNKTEDLRNKWIEALGDSTRLPKDMELYEKCDINKETLTL